MELRKKVKSWMNTLPYIKGLYQEKMDFDKNARFPPGHYYSTIVSVEDIKQREDIIWSKEKVDGIQGVDLRAAEQIKLLKALETYYLDIPFTKEQNEKNRYYYENDYYHYTDAIILYSLIRHYQPKQIIEVGSGFSSAVMLDTNEQFLNNSVQLTFIEPYPERLGYLLNEKDQLSTTLIEKNVQEVDLETFDKLNAGDFLFIDSTHVVKTGSDVNFILFEILPRLKSGVIVHFHDIFYPFEYPKDWVFKGWNWNETYTMRSFLMYNDRFEIRLFSDYLHRHHPDVYQNMPMAYEHHGSNLWLVKK